MNDVKIRNRFIPHACHLTLSLTGVGGGGSICPPPLYVICDCLATAADRDVPFHDFFLSSLTLRIFGYQVCENRTIGREVT